MPPAANDSQTYALIGVAMRVHQQLGTGFLEAVYQEAFGLELTAARIPYQAEVPFRIVFRDRLLRASYRADFVCFDEVLVKLKAINALSGVETAQVLNYLKASRLKRALLLNFGAPRLEYRRLVMTHAPTEGSATGPHPCAAVGRMLPSNQRHHLESASSADRLASTAAAHALQ